MPPSSDGADHVTCALVSPRVAATPVGAPGTKPGVTTLEIVNVGRELRAELESMKVAGQVGIRVAGEEVNFLPVGAEIKGRSE